MSAMSAPQNANGPTGPTLEGVKVRSPKSNRRSSAFLNSERSVKPLRVRIVIAGTEAAGKSCIIKRYCEKRFVAKYLPTVGIDYGATRIFVDKREVSVHIFDTSGLPIFTEVRNEFYKDAHGLLLVMDVTKRESFDSLADWLQEIKVELVREGRQLDNTVCFLAANKCDLGPDRREVDEMEAKLWAELHGFNFFETSASTGVGITDMFQAFFSQIVRLADSGLGTKTPRQGKKQVGTVTKMRERMTVSPASTIPPQPSTEQAAVMRRIRGGRDPWDQLGLARGAGREEVNRAYRKLAMLLHPDKTEVAGAQEAFKLIGLARNVILKTFRD
eukprot:GFUD01014897.1.p1 GENE.GFUD01014897.1~~GFUD01014897.1.p1  ORF type:complete len:330 (+),score=92.81 GFUD01014897.1:146-1135(+)